MAQSFLNRTDLPLGLRNNNPGNIRVTSSDQWQGMIGSNQGFVQFQDVSWGIRAMATILGNDILSGKNTIRKLISEYAPPSENNTAGYINNVSAWTGWGADQTLPATRETLFLLILAMMKMEIGSAAANLVIDSDIWEGLKRMNSELLLVFGGGNEVLASGAGVGIAAAALIIIYFLTHK